MYDGAGVNSRAKINFSTVFLEKDRKKKIPLIFKKQQNFKKSFSRKTANFFLPFTPASSYECLHKQF